MSKLFIPTTNCGKAHETDIYGVAICNSYTVSCSGDGYLKLWSNKLREDELPKDNVISEFVTPIGLHHVAVFHSVESNGSLVILVATVAFNGKIYFFEVDAENRKLKPISLLGNDESKYSYWACKFFKSDDKSVEHRFLATTVQGTTKVWKLNLFNMTNSPEDGTESVVKEYSPSLMLQGDIEAQVSNAMCVDISTNGLLATGFSDGSVVVSQLSTLRPIYNFEGFGLKGVEESSSTVRCVSFSPAGTLLAVANDSGSFGCVSLYETEFGERVGNFTVPSHSNQNSIAAYAHSGWVFDLSFNSTGEFLASCGYDAKVRIWDVKTRERLSTLNICASDIEIEEDITSEDEYGDSLKYPPVLGVTFIDKGIRSGLGTDSNEGLCCVCSDRSIRWFREAGGI